MTIAARLRELYKSYAGMADWVLNKLPETITRKAIVENSVASKELMPNVVYSFLERSSDLTLTLGSAALKDQAEEYMLFIYAAGTPTVTWDIEGLIWADGNAPSIADGKVYEVSIMNNIAYYKEVG